MSCSPFDLRDYVLHELPAAARGEVEAHARACVGCRGEMDRLRTAEAALLAVRDEEIPQRIAFVSDRIFEPSPLRRAWSAFWGSTARLGFASAAMLSAALVVHSLNRPAPAPAAPSPVAAVSTAALEASFERRLKEAVARAVAESEARQSAKTAALLAAAEQRNEMDRQAVRLAVEETFTVMQKRLNRMILASSDYGAPK